MSEISVIKIPAEGDYQITTMDNGIKSVQDAVQGYIEILRLTNHKKGKPPAFLIINEEGRLKNLPINVRATYLFNACAGGVLSLTMPQKLNVIVGDTFICGEDEDGNLASLSPEYLEIALDLINIAYANWWTKGGEKITKEAMKRPLYTIEEFNPEEFFK